MNTILEHYELKCNTRSDINEHLPTLFRYSSECDHITEMGVREVVSTWAFLNAKPRKMVSYDLYTSTHINEPLRLAKESGIDFSFVEANVLEVDIEKTDLLFIDTAHQYEQLKNELSKHSGKVKKYIILHDTTLFAHTDESTGNVGGLVKALDEFLEENSNWQRKEVFTNNNGLTVLERV